MIALDTRSINQLLIVDINECIVGHQVCGYGAECINLPGAHQCVCPYGYGGDPYNGLCSPAQKRCTNDNECKANEKCVQPGECVCPPPFYTDPLHGNLCKSESTKNPILYHNYSFHISQLRDM